MREEDSSQCILPANRTGSIVRWIDSVSLISIVFLGVATYLAVVLGCSIIEYGCSRPPEQTWVKSTDRVVESFWDILYFNFITVLTIGYGDYVPNGTGARVLAVVEALLGTGIITLTMSALIAKFLSPPKKAIVFSRYAYYCRDQEMFMVIYLNTTQNRVVNADQSAYFKLARDWDVTPPARSPLITRAVQTFYTVRVPEEEIIDKLNLDDPNDPRDLLRFGISGLIGGGAFSVAIEYAPAEIVVLPNRDALTAYPGFWNVDLKDPQFPTMFHYRPEGSPTLIEYVQNSRAEQNDAEA